jgi:hypothetical protein
MYLNTFIGGNVCATAKQAQERGGGHSSIPSLCTPQLKKYVNLKGLPNKKFSFKNQGPRGYCLRKKTAGSKIS